jgi:hypothetical protein
MRTAIKKAPNGQPLRQASRELAEECDVPFPTCLNWLEGRSIPDKTIDSWITDILLELMVMGQPEAKCYSLREIGNFTGLTHQRIDQIEKQALKKVRLHHHTKQIAKELNL